MVERSAAGAGQGPPARGEGSRGRTAEVSSRRSGTGSGIRGLYPGPEAIRPGRPLVIVEGEFDALCLGQELGELAAVVTLGSASGGPTPAILGRMLAAWPWFVATDRDQAGDKAAAGWPAPARRVRPPEPVQGLDRGQGRRGGPAPLVGGHPGRRSSGPRCSPGRTWPAGGGDRPSTIRPPASSLRRRLLEPDLASEPDEGLVEQAGDGGAVVRGEPFDPGRVLARRAEGDRLAAPSSIRPGPSSDAP